MIVLTGRGPGKTVTAALLASTHVVGAYDADPYRALTELYPKAEPYKRVLLEPCLVDTADTDALGRPYLHVLREHPDATAILITSPFRQCVAATARMAEDIKELTQVRVRGVVVTMANPDPKSGEEEAKRVARELALPLLGWIPLSPSVEQRLAAGERLDSQVDDERLMSRVLELGKTLGLQVREGITTPRRKRKGLLSLG